jgi:DNA polymerase I
MIEEGLSFVLHHTPPLEFGREPVLFRSTVEGDVEAISLEELAASDRPIVTHSFSLLVDWLRRKALPLPTTILDLEVAKKLLVGRPRSEFRTEPPWTMPQMLLNLVPLEYRSDQVELALKAHMGVPAGSKANDLNWMIAITRELPKLWRAMRLELESNGERRRFDDVEVPVYNAMLEAQYRGLCVDMKERDLLLKSLERQYLSAHHQLAIREGVDVDRAFVDLNYLSSLIDYRHESEELTSADELIQTLKHSNPICSLLDCVEEARENRRILLRTGGHDGWCFPMYDTMGTVTGRIMTTDPQLQYLKKPYRRVIAARAEHRLIYFDYAYFEPNIMANVAHDPNLLSLCNNGDLYESLSIELFANVSFRETVKQMFLSYSYGMTVDRLTDYLLHLPLTKEDAEKIIEMKFAPLFSGIEVWKDSVESRLFSAGRIESALGSHRYRAKSGDLDAKEKRWAVSQVIQGTGSLILKKAIIMINQRLPEVSILLPMHDALLVEVPEESLTELTLELLKCLRNAFLNICPLGSAAVKIKGFAEA